MNGVDLANQFRAWMTTSRPGIYKAWQPLWYWLLDICACNAFLIWKTTHLELDLSSTRLHRQFQEGLIQALLDIPEEEHTAIALPGHFRTRFATRSQCEWCKAHPEERQLKWKPRQPVLGEVVNGVRPTGPIRPPDTINGCGLCGKHLCLRGPCFDRFNSQIRS